MAKYLVLYQHFTGRPWDRLLGAENVHDLGQFLTHVPIWVNVDLSVFLSSTEDTLTIATRRDGVVILRCCEGTGL